MENEKEIWKPIKWFEGLYEVSNFGKDGWEISIFLKWFTQHKKTLTRGIVKIFRL